VTNLILEGQEATKTFVGEWIDALQTTVTVAMQNLVAPVTDNDDDDFEGGDNDPAAGTFTDGQEDNTVEQPALGSRFRSYAHGGRFWDTPPDFEFAPEMHPFGNGLTLWIVGLPGYTIKAQDGSTLAAPVQPFRSLKPKLLPAKLRSQYLVNWRPIFKMMEEAPGINIPNDPSAINAAVIQETLEKAKAYVKTWVSYVFNKRKANPEVWKVATWLKHVARSNILKHGTAG
jgi:hypothetical protein